MKTFTFYSPTTLQQTLTLLENFGSEGRLLAGGTDLLVRMKIGKVTPQVVIDIKNVIDLDSKVEIVGNEMRIGALATMGALQDNELVRKYFQALSEAVMNIGSVQIRNRATIAGNLCNASPAADSAPSLLIYLAQVKCVSKQGERLLDLKDFLLGPGKTTLDQGELIKEIILPIPDSHQAASFVRLSRRKGVDLATINLCCQVTNLGITRFALGAVGPVPFIVEDSTGVLASTSISFDQKKELLDSLMGKATPISDVRASKEYRKAMLSVLGQRALATAIERLQEVR